MDETPLSPINEKILQIREKSSEYWLDNADKLLDQHLGNAQNLNQAKNIIYFLGDGMSMTTIAASRIFQGQLNGRRGEENFLSFEKFPNVGISKVIEFLLKSHGQPCEMLKHHKNSEKSSKS